ncbi:hypothetical protein I4U23_004230 [Adineta vaga]|nr:hypothetical protein I4U23_004230 [Adineta vaga]
MNFSIIEIASNQTDYRIIVPVSMIFAITAIIITSCLLIIVILTKKLHTVTHLLTCNTCLASILYCIVQCNNYIYLLMIISNKSDQSCRWRGYFGYISIVAFIYSYVLQVISRLFFVVFHTKYRWLITYRVHFYLIFIGWIIIFILPLPAILTNDIYFREGELCWVTRSYELHTYYTIIVYYVIPIVLIIIINIIVFMRIRSNRKNIRIQYNRKRKDRDYIIFRNIMISLSVYFLGGIPLTIYMLTSIEFFYPIGIISVSIAVTMEKLVIIYLDRDIRILIKNYFCQNNARIIPVRINVPFIIHR